MSSDERFLSIYQKNLKLLKWIAKKNRIPKDEVEDIVQETFFAYYGHYPLTWDDRKVRYYLAKILTNKCRDYYRSRNRRPVEYMDPTELRNISFGNKVGQDPSIIIMYTLQGISIREISEMMNISEAACRMRLMRGRELLYQMVERDRPLTVKQKSPKLARKKSKDSSYTNTKYASQPRYIPISQLSDS